MLVYAKPCRVESRHQPHVMVLEHTSDICSVISSIILIDLFVLKIKLRERQCMPVGEFVKAKGTITRNDLDVFTPDKSTILAHIYGRTLHCCTVIFMCLLFNFF
jgi:hypothetical protein